MNSRIPIDTAARSNGTNKETFSANTPVGHVWIAAFAADPFADPIERFRTVAKCVCKNRGIRPA